MYDKASKLNDDRRYALAKVALRHLKPADIIECILSDELFPESSLEDQGTWAEELFHQHSFKTMRRECASFGTASDSVFRVAPESFDLDKFSQAVETRAPVLLRFLSALIHRQQRNGWAGVQVKACKHPAERR